MTKGIFVTATGTDVGKTYVSGLVVKKLRENNLNCGYYKPALSGAEVLGTEIIPGDAEYVVKKTGLSGKGSDYVSYMFKPAVSPHLAASIENNPIKIDKIKSDFNNLKKKFDFVVVEGAGGIVCPFNLKDGLFLPDVIKALGLDIIVVASASLGTINSTVLTVEYAKQKGINVSGIILNNYDENDYMQRDNLEQVEALTGVKVLCTVKCGDDDLGVEADVLKTVFKEIY